MATNFHSQPTLLKAGPTGILIICYLTGVRSIGIAVAKLRSPLKIGLPIAVARFKAKALGAITCFDGRVGDHRAGHCAVNRILNTSVERRRSCQLAVLRTRRAGFDSARLNLLTRNAREYRFGRQNFCFGQLLILRLRNEPIAEQNIQQRFIGGRCCL